MWCGVGEVPSCGSAAPALQALLAPMEEAGGDGAPWEHRCPDGRCSSAFPQNAQQIRAERTAARKEELEQVGGSEGSSSQLGILTPLAVQEDLGPNPSGPWDPTQPPLVVHALSCRRSSSLPSWKSS